MQSNFAGRRIGHSGEWWHYALSAAAHASPHDAQEPVRVQSPIVIADKSNFSPSLIPSQRRPPFNSPRAYSVRHSQPSVLNNACTYVCAYMSLNAYICDGKINVIDADYTVAIAFRLRLTSRANYGLSHNNRYQSTVSFLYVQFGLHSRVRDIIENDRKFRD